MLSTEKISQLVDAGYPVFRVHRSKPVSRLPDGSLVFQYEGREIPLDKHFKDWMYQVNPWDTGMLQGPGFNKMHRHTWLVKFPKQTVVLGLLDSQNDAETAVETAISFLADTGVKGADLHAELVI